MTIQRKAFRPIYRAIKDGQLSEREAYDILCGIFSVNIQYEYIPQFANCEQNSVEDEAQTNEITVKGFCNNG